MDFQKDLYKLFLSNKTLFGALLCNIICLYQVEPNVTATLSHKTCIFFPICNITIVNGARGDFIMNRIDRGAARIFTFHVIYIM